MGQEVGKRDLYLSSGVRSNLRPVVRPLKHWMVTAMLSAVCVVSKNRDRVLSFLFSSSSFGLEDCSG